MKFKYTRECALYEIEESGHGNTSLQITLVRHFEMFVNTAITSCKFEINLNTYVENHEHIYRKYMII